MPNQLTPIIVATHGDLASALLETMEAIAGVQPDLSGVGLVAGDDVQGFRNRIVALLPLDQPVLILVDMPGGTPWNVAISIANTTLLVRVVSGVNLPMLLEVVLSRQSGGSNIDRLAQLAHQAGMEAITVAHIEARL